MTWASIRELSVSFRKGSASPVAVTSGMLGLIERYDGALNTFITVLKDSALRSAAESEKRLKAGSPLSPLDGVPVAVKDLFYIEGIRCTAGSKILADNMAHYDSTAVRKLKAAGAVILGTTNLHEFAAGVTGNNPFYGPVRNPWDPSKVAGGSSGGSAASVAAGFAAGALGTDTAGSIRIPAALCGTVGLKPTYGRVSRLGVVPLASSLDTVGTLNASAWDAAAMLQVLAGHEEGDITTSSEPVPDYLAELAVPFHGLKVGVPRMYFHDIIDPSVERNFEAFLERLRELGCSVADIELDGASEVYDQWLPIRRAEATAFHLSWLDRSPELYGDDVRKLLELGRGVKAVDYVRAINARPSYIERFLASMKDVDVAAVPATCIPAPAIGATEVLLGGRTVEVYHALNRLTLPFNYTGFPCVTVPSGSVGGLPLGVQLVGKLFEEGRALSLANAYEAKFGLFLHPTLGKAFDAGTA